MKQFFGPILLLLAWIPGVLGASFPDNVPIYPNENQFTYIARHLALKDGTELTNPIVNGVPWTNISSGATLWTNSAGTLMPLGGNSVLVTNLFSQTLLTAGGAFITRSQSAILIHTGNNVIDPAGLGFIYVVADGANAVVKLNAGNGEGQHVWIFNAFTNIQWSLPAGPLNDDTNLNVFVRGGSWSPSQVGESLELARVPGGWSEVNRSDPNGAAPAVTSSLLWTTNFDGSLLQPLNFSRYLQMQGPVLVGTNTDSYSGNGAFFSIRDTTRGEADYNALRVTVRNVTNQAAFDSGVTTTNAFFQSYIQGGDWRAAAFVSAADTYYVISNAIGQQMKMSQDGLYFGTGTTNLLRRAAGTGTGLEFYNPYGAGAAYIRVYNGANSAGVYVEDQSHSGQFITSEPNAIWGNSTYNLQFELGKIVGNTDGIQLGQDRIEFGDFWTEGTIYGQGWRDGTGTNYSRYTLQHTGTNGDIVLNSISGGIAGAPRPIKLSWNGTNLFDFNFANSPNLAPTLTLHEIGTANTTTLAQSGGIAVLLGSTIELSTGSAMLTVGNSIQIDSGSHGRIDHFGYNTITGSSGFDIRHTGTNGLTIFETFASGDAGNPRDLSFQSNGSEFASLTTGGALTVMKAYRQLEGVLTHAGTVTLDFDGTATANAITLTGSVTYAFSNLDTNRVYSLRMQNTQATNCTITWPAGIHGYYTTTVSNATWCVAALRSFGTVASNVWVSTASEGTY